MKTIYLCGPINGCTDSEAKNWREYCKEHLGNYFNILDPMRRDYRGNEAENIEEIIEGDLRDIDNSDIILANAQKPTWGTAMEIYDAFSKGKYVVTVCDSPRPSPWLIGHSQETVKCLD